MIDWCFFILRVDVTELFEVGHCVIDVSRRHALDWRFLSAEYDPSEFLDLQLVDQDVPLS